MAYYKQRAAISSSVFVVVLGGMAGLAEEDRDASIPGAETDGSGAEVTIVDVEIDELAMPIERVGQFSMRELPEKIRSLHNKRVRIRGYMYPTFSRTGFTEFVLNGETRRNAVHWAADSEDIPIHFQIWVSLREEKSGVFTLRPIVVEGIFRITPQSESGVLWRIFRIDDAAVAPTEARPGFRRSVGFGC